MQDRRKEQRLRSILGGVISFNKRRSTLDCCVRNFSEHGARVEFNDTALLPETFDLTIVRKETTFHARTTWRTQTAAGVRFIDEAASDAVPLDWARKVQALEAQNKQLRRRVADLSESAI
jgi:PilZ domain